MPNTALVRPDYTPGPAPLDRLPFVKRTGKRTERGNWRVEPADYGTACAKGREYAAHVAIYLKDNPFWVGSNLIGCIAADMDFSDDSDSKGYWVGFFSFLEMMIYHFSRDHDAWAYFEQVAGEYAAINAAREQEAQA